MYSTYQLVELGSIFAAENLTFSLSRLQYVPSSCYGCVYCTVNDPDAEKPAVNDSRVCYPHELVIFLANRFVVSDITVGFF